jgi:hypothetical protein
MGQESCWESWTLMISCLQKTWTPKSFLLKGVLFPIPHGVKLYFLIENSAEPKSCHSSYLAGNEIKHSAWLTMNTRMLPRPHFKTSITIILTYTWLHPNHTLFWALLVHMLASILQLYNGKLDTCKFDFWTISVASLPSVTRLINGTYTAPCRKCSYVTRLMSRNGVGP